MAVMRRRFARQTSQLSGPVDSELRYGRSIWPRVVWSVVVVLVCGVLAYGIFLVATLACISTNPLGLDGLVTDNTGRTNVLILGVGDPGHAGEGLSDTMMVLIADQTLRRVAQVSIPRDLRVTIPGYGVGKINQANALGGPALAQSVVSATLGVPTPYFVRTDFSGLKTMVDAVGGLDINVKQRLYDPEYPCDDNQYQVCGLDIEPGLQHMDGTKVLQYARCRKDTCGNDFGRAVRQQEVVNLLKDKALRVSLLFQPRKLTALVTAMHQFVQTNLGVVQMIELAQEWSSHSRQQPPVQLVLSTAPGGLLTSAPGSTDLLPLAGDFSVIDGRIQNIFSESSGPAN